jgi:hypothetical protein
MAAALMLGAIRRIFDRPSLGVSAVLGLACVLFAFSRQFEGLLFILPAFGFLIRWSLLPANRQFVLQRVVVPASVVVLLGAGWIAYDNHRVTGNALVLPYVHYTRLYNAAPLFLFQSPPPTPGYRHPDLSKLNIDSELALYHRERTADGFQKEMRRRGWVVLSLYVLPWTWLLVVGLHVARSGLGRGIDLLPWIQTITVLLGTCASMAFNPQYVSPILPALIIIGIRALRSTASLRIGPRDVGKGLALGMIFCAIFAGIGWTIALHRDAYASWNFRRVELVQNLINSGGKHLVIVRYGPDHSADDEWVYNDADIDASPVVWARDFRTEFTDNRPLLDYFKDRSAWLLQIDASTMRLDPYPR